jgi:SPP1 family predicted phage head-tail adaptor
MLAAAKLDRRIVLQRATFAQDATGQQIATWATLATVWASKQDVSDGERIAAAEVSAEITTRFQIRWGSPWSDLNPKDRVSYDGRTYDISAVKEIGRRVGLEITAAARSD